MTPQELKNSILQMAIQGKLVEQRPEEGTAEELYRQIQEEKQRHIESGNIKKEKPLPEISEGEKPFEIPESWIWLRLGTLCSIVNGFTPLRSNELFWENPTIAWFTVEDIHTCGRRITRTHQAINECALAANTERVLPPGTVLLCCTASVGEYAIAEIPLTTNQQFNGLVIKDEYKRMLDSEFLFQIAPIFKMYLLNVAGKTTFNFISVKKLSNLIVPIPPFAEQKRIMIKLEELLPCINRYEQAWTRLEDFNKHFPTDMKKSILQMAIQGKLVEQRPEEGTAEELYQYIQAEKLQLIKAGKIKKDNLLPEITVDEEPFDIPENWKWIRLGEITQFQGGYAFKSSTYVPLSNNQVIRLGNVKPNTLLLDEKQVFIPDDIASATIDYKLKENDILVTMTGTRKKRDYFFTLAVSAKDLASRNLFLNQRVGCLRIYGLINIKYLLCVLQNEHIKDLIFAKETGTANQGNIGSEDMKCSILVPLPPLAEQKRIVTKLEEILPLCEKLI